MGQSGSKYSPEAEAKKADLVETNGKHAAATENGNGKAATEVGVTFRVLEFLELFFDFLFCCFVDKWSCFSSRIW